MCQHEFVEVSEGTDIHGKHKHIYKCEECGLLDIGTENITLEIPDE